MKTRSLKTRLTHLALTVLALSALYSAANPRSALAYEGALDHHAEDTSITLKHKSHSIHGMMLPLLLFNSLHLAYEYKVTPKLGVRGDGLLLMSMGGHVVAGGLGISYIPVSGESDSASHGLELNAGVTVGTGGGGHCDASVFNCDMKSFQLIKGFVGYRYQKFSGFQFRGGLAPLMTFKGEFVESLPEITIGFAF